MLTTEMLRTHNDRARLAVIAHDGKKADLVAFARGALEDPNWPVHARHILGGDDNPYAYAQSMLIQVG